VSSSTEVLRFAARDFLKANQLVFSYKGGDCTKSALLIDAVSPTREYDMRHKRAERETEREIERERERERFQMDSYSYGHIRLIYPSHFTSFLHSANHCTAN
jgi:hypothetical protein